MKTARLVLLAVVTALFSFGHSTIACAQSLVGNTSAVSVGDFFADSGAAKKYGGDSQLYISYQYTVPVNVPFTATKTIVAAEFETGTGNGGHSNVVPITIGEFLGGDGKSPYALHNYYGGVGIGAYIENIGHSSSTVRAGGYAAVGYNFAHDFYVQAKYQIVESANGPILSAGVRF